MVWVTWIVSYDCFFLVQCDTLETFNVGLFSHIFGAFMVWVSWIVSYDCFFLVQCDTLESFRRRGLGVPGYVCVTEKERECVYVCACVGERERKRERKINQSFRRRGLGVTGCDRVCVCDRERRCVWVCVTERERARACDRVCVRERERERANKRVRKRERERVCGRDFHRFESLQFGRGVSSRSVPYFSLSRVCFAGRFHIYRSLFTYIGLFSHM